MGEGYGYIFVFNVSIKVNKYQNHSVENPSIDEGAQLKKFVLDPPLIENTQVPFFL